MEAFDFRRWRKALGYTQSEAAKELGFSRATIGNWEGGVTRVPQIVCLACQQLNRSWKQRLEFGPVTLVYSDEELWDLSKSEPTSVFIQCEIFPNSAVALRRAVRFTEHADFKSPFMIDQHANIVLATPELLRRVRALKRKLNKKPI